jgi:hypothetical protein
MCVQELTSDGRQGNQTDSGGSSTSQSNQSLHSLRGTNWRSSWSSSVSSPHDPSSSVTGHGIAPTAIAEIVSDEDSPKRTTDGTLRREQTPSKADAAAAAGLEPAAAAGARGCSKTSESASGAARPTTFDAFDAAIVRAKSELIKTKPLRSASVDRRSAQAVPLADGGRTSGLLRYPLASSQSVRLTDYGNRPYVKHKSSLDTIDGRQRTVMTKKPATTTTTTAFGVASHVEPTSATLDRSCEQLLRLCTPPRECGQPSSGGSSISVGGGSSSANSVCKVTASKSELIGFGTEAPPCGERRTTPPRAVVESDLEDEIVDDERQTLSSAATTKMNGVDCRGVTRQKSARLGDDGDKELDGGSPSQTFSLTADHTTLTNGQPKTAPLRCSTSPTSLANVVGKVKVKDDSDLLTKSMYFEQRQATNGGPRAKRSGSYHGLVHHSVVVTDSAKSRRESASSIKSPVDSLKSALTSFAGKFSTRRSVSTVSTAAATMHSTQVEAERGCREATRTADDPVALKPAVVVDRGGLVSRLIARASGRFPKRRSKSGDRTGSGGGNASRRNRDRSVAAIPMNAAADRDATVGNGFPERRPASSSLRSRSPGRDGPRRSVAACSRSKSVDLCEVVDLDGNVGDEENSCDDDDDDVMMCRLICGGPSWSDGIDQKTAAGKHASDNGGQTCGDLAAAAGRHRVPFIDDSETEE